MNYWICLFSVMSLLLGCTPTPPELSPTIRMAIAQAPLTLDPRYATDAASERVNRLLYERLVEFDVASKVMPGLAEWQQLTPLHYQFTLTRMSHFHDGSLLSAQDVKATYDSVIALKESPHRSEFMHVARIVAEGQTVHFYLTQADPHFVEKLIIGILPAQALAKGHDFSHQPIGSGPFKCIQWQSTLSLQRVADGLKVTLTEVKDPTVRVLKLMRGETELLQGDMPPELVRYLKSKPDITVVSHEGSNFSYLGLNMQDPVLNQPKVRQALAHAIDRQTIVRQVMVDQTRVASAILPPEHYAGNAQLAAHAYRPLYARSLLKEAGIKLPLKLVYKTSTDAQRVRLVTILQAQMAPAGIDLEIRSLDWGTFFEDVKQGHFQLYGLTWVGIKTPEIYAKAFASHAVPPQGFNRGRYSDEVLDALLAQEDWSAVTQRIHDQLPYIPLWYEGQFAAYRAPVKQYTLHADGNWDGLVSLQLIR